MSTRRSEAFHRPALRCGVHMFTLVLCTAFLVVGSCIAARAELANPSGEPVIIAFRAFAGDPLGQANSWGADGQHGLFDHRMLDDASSEPLLVAQKATAPSAAQTEAEQRITDLLDAALIAAHSVADVGERISTLTSIARVQAEAGDDHGAARSISEALSAARSAR